MWQPSTQHFLALIFCSAVCLISASPLPLPAGNQELDVLQIPLANGKEIDVLTLGAKDQDQLIADRNKRTIGLLRELFPDITKSGATDTKIDLSAINKQLEETIRVARQVKEAEAAAAAAAQSSGSPIAQAPIPLKSNEPIQLSFNNELSSVSAGSSGTSSGSIGATDVKALSTNDLQLSESKSPAIDELSLDSVEDTADLDDRNKRFLSFGGAGLAGGSSGGAAGASPSGNSLGGGGGGSGNFLLDVVRLFSGSVQTQQGDEAANSVSGGASSSSSTDDTDAGSDSTRNADGYTEGIPGPVTRLVVLANRGLANLVQDLILRVAATSEKFVNFKAKLITALI
ncbi:keratin, type II cytoskeletal 2 epidermal isoform X2 [Drosophila hydei]|uniref:Keratin, type II cytoskeletal 2 epidermal isoform X2 n=1 Tax=Drosophila hydei TaxID=7224 RepID=A0A6J1MCR6_DROHY|nr:keratin, type II cytoskeletal 2 epidermal isoform X2 [Drosophila hydei]